MHDQIDEILQYSNRVGVTIIFDYLDSSDEAILGYKYSFERKNKILKIFVGNLDEGDEDRLLPLVLNSYHNGDIILNINQNSLLDTYKKYASENPDEELLSFFATRITKEDLEALKMALFIRNQNTKGENITEYKKSIKDRFGPRGANIANLCSAGYFEQFKEIYTQLPKEDADRFYELAVGKKALALFVHSGMTLEGLETEFLRLVDKVERYHISYFRVHGFGHTNVKLIKKLFAEIDLDLERYIVQPANEIDSPPAIVYEIKVVLD